MSTSTLHDGLAVAPRHDGRGAAYLRSRATMLLPWLVGFWMFSGGVVMFEPSPYEFVFLLVLPVALFAGMPLYKGTLNLFNLMALFLPFSLIAALQVHYSSYTKSFIYMAVTFFLFLTTYFAANYVAASPNKRMRQMMNAYLAIAVIVALIGLLAYLGLIPGRDLFLRYERAKATFKDPNVYGPFLILPAMFALQRILLLRGKAAILASLVYVILFLGVFASFSRAAWGHFVFSSGLVFVLVYAMEATAKDKVRMMVIALVGVAAVLGLLALLLSIDSVRELFLLRFSLEQNYDSGSTGRFGRQAYAFGLALANPWGIGPDEFRHLRISEEPHNLYVNVFLVYGWGGGAAFISLMFMTLWRALKHLFLPSPNRLLLVPLFSVYLALMLESAIIDSDHWRHLYLVMGLIWGVTTRYWAWDQPDRSRARTVI